MCLYSMTSVRSVDPEVYDTLPQYYSKPTTQHIYCRTISERGKGIIQRLRIQNSRNFRMLMRVQPMCAPRKARPLPRLWSDHGCALFFSMRGACDHWCKYYNGWSYIIYREFSRRRQLCESSLCVKYVYITALTVQCQRHTWR